MIGSVYDDFNNSTTAYTCILLAIRSCRQWRKGDVFQPFVSLIRSSSVGLKYWCKWLTLLSYIVFDNMGGCQSTRHTVNSSPGRLVTRSIRHRSTRYLVDSSRSRLITKRRSTRHKQTNKQTSKPYYCSSNYPNP